MKTSITIIYASTSGNTEHVVDTMANEALSVSSLVAIQKVRAEHAVREDLLSADLAILASGTWNTGGTEGQLNPHMVEYLTTRVGAIDLQKRPMTFISLGDDRYFFRTRCTEHFLRFQRESNGKLLLPPFVLVNEPYGQEEKMQKWMVRCIEKIQKET